MADEYITIEVDVADLMRALEQAPREVERALKRAGLESANKILNTRGLKSYPEPTSANFPPTPYYIRGRGTQYAKGNKGESERYGAQWNVRYQDLNTSVTIGNRASYAKYLAGDEQARAMGKIGWKKLKEVARDMLGEIKSIYDGWIKEALRRAGLR